MRKQMRTIIQQALPVFMFSATFIATSALAQDAPKRSGAVMLEEIIVTAQKRPESLQDVPISITTVSGEKMAQAGVFKIEDLQTFTPNLSMSETGISTQIYIRGIGTGNNQGFEQSVGQYVDGVYYGRQQLLRMPFLDLERVEVLRGPQSILFGKNSIAGALSMTTAKPSKEWEGSVSASYAKIGGIKEFQGMVSGPFSDTLRGRLVVRKYDEDGFIKNGFKGKDEASRDEFAVRGTLLWEATDKLDISLKLERDKFDVRGRQIEIVRDDPSTAFPAGHPLAGARFGQILGALGDPKAITETFQNNERQADTAEFSSNRVDNYTLTLNYQIGDYTLTAISGWVGYEFDEICDCDFVAAPIFDALLDEEYDQFSQEIRLVSPGGEVVDWIAGVFYQTSELDYRDAIRVFDNSVLGRVRDGALRPTLGTEAARTYTTDSDLWAAFAQATWNITDTLRLTAGARYTSEDKTATREINILDTSTQAIALNAVAPFVYKAAFAIESEQSGGGHSLAGKRDESSFTPLLNIQWDATGDIMLYGSFSTGFKSGGFDARSNTPSSWEFDKEEAATYELGAKTRLLNGSVELNAALYRTEYDNLQVSQFDGTLGFNVGNAKKTTVQGVEIDGRWAFTHNLTMSYSLAYLDHVYKDYSNGNCYNRQVPDGDIVVAGVEQEGGSFEGRLQLCDYSGKSGQYTPEWTGTLSLDHFWPIGGLEWRSGIDVSYVDEQNTHVNLHPLYNVDALTRVNLRVGLYANNWKIALLAQNVTDKQQLTYVGNTPLSGSAFGTNTFYSFVSRPRTLYLQASYNF